MQREELVLAKQVSKKNDLREREKVGPFLVFLFFIFLYCFLFPLVDQDHLLCFSFLTLFFLLYNTHTHEKIKGEAPTVSLLFFRVFFSSFPFCTHQTYTHIRKINEREKLTTLKIWNFLGFLSFQLLSTRNRGREESLRRDSAFFLFLLNRNKDERGLDFSVFLEKKREFNSSLLAILATGPRGKSKEKEK